MPTASEVGTIPIPDQDPTPPGGRDGTIAAPYRRRRAAAVAAYALVAAIVSALLAWPGLATGDEAADLLRGPDDFMRMVQVADWLDGQAWRDTAQHRLDPPDGVAMHWSRLADVPLAAAVLATEGALGRERAMHAAAVVAPALLGGILVALFFWLAAPLVPDARVMAPLTAVPALFMPLAQFRPGRVDHHGLQLVLVALAVGFLLRSLGTGRASPAAAGGAVAGVSLAVGLETLPFVATAASCLALAAVVRRDAAPSLAAFGAALCVVAAATLLLTAPLPEWRVAACDRLSLPHLAGAATCAAAGGAAVALRRMRPASGWPLALFGIGGLGVAGLTLVVMLFPQCALGPYAEMAADIRYWFDKVREGRTLIAFLADRPGTAVTFVLLPLAAVVAGALRLARQRCAPRTAVPQIALLALALSGLAVLAWQIRGVGYAGLTAAVALLPLAADLNARAGRLARLHARLALRLALPAACVAAMVLPVAIQLELKPADGNSSEPGCDLAGVLDALNDPAGLAANRVIVAAPIDLGPEILLHTPHAVLAAPYHRNVGGLVDHRRIFAGDEAEALATIARRGVEAVLFCPGSVHVTARPGQPGFLNERLADDRPPDWLVPVARAEALSLFRVDVP